MAAPAKAGSGAVPSDAADARLELDLYGETHELAWPRDMVLLDLLQSHGIEVAYSCREGSCGTCICSIERGKVQMRENAVLGPSDLAAGYVLACQSVPDADDCKIVF
jgi:3-ketosteroid 9alpha-monooxygenase subunit B